MPANFLQIAGDAKFESLNVCHLSNHVQQIAFFYCFKTLIPSNVLCRQAKKTIAVRNKANRNRREATGRSWYHRIVKATFSYLNGHDILNLHWGPLAGSPQDPRLTLSITRPCSILSYSSMTSYEPLNLRDDIDILSSYIIINDDCDPQ